MVLGPRFVRHHRFERRLRNLDVELHRALVPFVHDGAVGPPRVVDTRRPDEKPGDLLDRLLRRRQADALHATVGDRLEPLEREGEVRAASRADHGVNLVDDDGARGAQHLAAALRRQQQVQRLWRRHQDVRRRAEHGGALGLRRVAGTNGARHATRRQPHVGHHAADAAPGLGKVLVDVGAQRLQR